MSKLVLTGRLLLLIALLASCSPASTPPAPTSIVAQPTNAAPATPQQGYSPFQTGRRYSDALDDMTVSFLDVVAFQATVDEEAQTLDVLLQMRDIPEMADLGLVKNLIEYSWVVDVYLDPGDVERDYYVSLNTSAKEPAAAANRLTAIPGEPKQVPIYQLFENKSIYDSFGRPIQSVNVEVNPDRNTLLLTGRVPRITSRAVFSFNTMYQESIIDRPDNYVVPESASLSTALPEDTTPAVDDPARLVPIGDVHAFPGPQHYAGDILTFEIVSDNSFDETFTVSMALDGGTPIGVTAGYTPYGLVLLPMAFDTTNLTGRHKLQFTTADGILDETYNFDVLPADQRPVNETQASWTTTETDCCIFHVLSETAAARDINFISEHFQAGANELEAILQEEIQSKMDVYIIDRIMGNGGFGGGGKLMISYTDRYYGPTLGAAGLETLARHEFSHASDISLEGVEDGLDYNYEGLAVYVAGGHYKPEPLAQRGAALFDLGYFVPVDEFIPQHELSYLHAALILTYIADTYGQTKVWEFLRADDKADGQFLPMADAIQSTFGISLDEFNQGIQAWLERNDPGEQLDDLRLTIELQDSRREYQDIYSSQPMFLLLEQVEAVQRPEYRTMVMREAHAPANIAVELIIANAQRAIIDGDYSKAEELNGILAEILDTGALENPVARDYLDIVLAAAEEGYEVVDLEIIGDRAETRVTAISPALIDMEFQKVDGMWQIQP